MTVTASMIPFFMAEHLLAQQEAQALATPIRPITRPPAVNLPAKKENEGKESKEGSETARKTAKRMQSMKEVLTTKEKRKSAASPHDGKFHC